MMELIQLAPRTYYIRNITNIGIYVAEGNRAWIIDTGVDKLVGKRILKIVGAQGWQVGGIINTHSHADHIGGNAHIQEETHCPVYASRIEAGFIECPELEAMALLGGCPGNLMSGKFFRAQASQPEYCWTGLPKGLSIFPLYGHAGGMIGVKTDDEVFFIGDAVLDAATIEKHGICYNYNIKSYLAVLDWLEQNLQGKQVVPSHAAPTEDVALLTAVNRKNAMEIIAMLEDICSEGAVAIEHIYKRMLDHYGVVCDFGSYQLNTSTLRSYLTYLCDEGRIQPVVQENMLYYQGC